MGIAWASIHAKMEYHKLENILERRMDNDQIQALAQGSRQALESVYRQFGPQILRYLRSLGCTQAEDILQETFIALFKQASKLRPDSTLIAWLFKVARNKASKLKANRRFLSLDVSDFPHQKQNSIEQIAVQKAVQALEEPFRSTLILFHWHGLSLEEIASITDTQPNTVKTRLFRARQSLKSKLNKSNQKLDLNKDLIKENSGTSLPRDGSYFMSLQLLKWLRKTVKRLGLIFFPAGCVL